MILNITDAPPMHQPTTSPAASFLPNLAVFHLPAPTDTWIAENDDLLRAARGGMPKDTEPAETGPQSHFA
jgi:hypothetical protein